MAQNEFDYFLSLWGNEGKDVHTRYFPITDILFSLLANHNNMEQTKEKTEAETRLEGFRKEYLDLVKKYDVDFISYPQYTQTEDGAYATVIGMKLVDRKSIPVPSPMAKDGKIIK